MNCKDCEHFMGYNHEDGTPRCSYEFEDEFDYEACPYAEDGNVETKETNLVVSIDLDDMKLRIENAFKNSIASQVDVVIEGIARRQFEDIIKDRTKEVIEQKIQDSVTLFFGEDIKVGGGWREEATVMTRQEYLSKTIEDALKGKIVEDQFAKHIAADTTKAIEKFTSDLKMKVNANVQKLFTTAMHQNLTDSIVNMLMSNETYQNLDKNIQNLLN